MYVCMYMYMYVIYVCMFGFMHVSACACVHVTQKRQLEVTRCFPRLCFSTDPHLPYALVYMHRLDAFVMSMLRFQVGCVYDEHAQVSCCSIEALHLAHILMCTRTHGHVRS